MLRVLLVVVLGLMMHSARSFAPDADLGALPAGTTLAAGYLLLSAFLAGGVFKALGLPRLTGYLVVGVVTGPEVLGLVSTEMIGDLRVLNGVAVSLIALTAGTELHVRTLRPLLRGIVAIGLVGVVGTILLLAITVYLVRDLLPFMAELDLLQQVAVAGVLGVTMVAQSPAVVVALRDEMEADGPMMRTVMGVVVAADLVVIILFAGTSATAQAALGGDVGLSATARSLLWSIFGSMGAGVVVATLVFAYFKRFGSGGALVVVALSVLISEVGDRLFLDPLIVSLTAGVLLRNLTDVGDDLRREIESGSLPVYVAFFAVAGAGIHLSALAAVGVPAAIFVATRATGLLLGSSLGARLAGAPEMVRRYAGYGLLPQAGLALALALLFQRAFPTLGNEAAALVFGIVGLNELAAPILMRLAIVRAGEAGARAPLDGSAGSVGSATGAHVSEGGFPEK